MKSITCLKFSEFEWYKCNYYIEYTYFFIKIVPVNNVINKIYFVDIDDLNQNVPRGFRCYDTTVNKENCKFEEGFFISSQRIYEIRYNDEPVMKIGRGNLSVNKDCIKWSVMPKIKEVILK